jgi:hypothetical protein
MPYFYLQEWCDQSESASFYASTAEDPIRLRSFRIGYGSSADDWTPPRFLGERSGGRVRDPVA